MPAQLHFGANNSVSVGTTNGGTANSVSFSKASLGNAAIGDVLIAWIHNQTPNSGTITPPSGWVHVGPDAGNPSYSNSRLSGIYYYPIPNQQALDALPATITWTFSLTGRVASHIVRATGIDLSNPVEVTSTSFPGGGNSTSTTFTGLTTTHTNTMLVGVLYHQNSASTSSPSTTAFMTNFQEYKTAATGSTLANTGTAIGYQQQSAAGATGNVTATFDSTVTAYSGALVAFRSNDSSSPDSKPYIRYTSATGVLLTGTIRYTSATDTLAIPSEVRPFPTGYSSLSAMLSQSPFYVAHRAGSSNWPEHSLHAYTQAAFWGVGALELSVHRTSDGVWFGLHDNTLDRTSGTSNYSPSSHTWAEVQQYMISAAATDNPAQPARPYARWEEIIDAYYSSHVFFVDIKEDWAYSNELIDKMDALPGNPKTKFIGKSYGPGSTPASTMGWNLALKQRGYMTWGYFYEADYPANVTNSQSVYDVLGMDYTASQAAWDHIKSFNKKVIGHIVPNATAANTALTKGADGLMVSGVTSVVPRFQY